MSWDFAADFDTVTRVCTMASMLLVSLAALRLSWIAPIKPHFYRWAGIVGVAATVAYFLFTFGGLDMWLDATRLGSMVRNFALAAGIWRTGTLGRRFLELDGGEDAAETAAETAAELERMKDELRGERGGD